MIRFACPTCAAEYSVDDDKAGKVTRCGKCRAKFAVPEAETAARPRLRPVADAEDDDRPSRRSARTSHRDEDEEEVRPSRRSRRDEDEEDDFDDRPRKRRSRRRDDDVECKKVSAGVLALLLGGWGVHKFYLGYTVAGVIQLVLTFATCGVAGLVPLVEGIIYLTKSDREFVRTYQRGRKEWF